MVGWEGQFCDQDMDGCEEINCFEGVECFDNIAPLTGANCGPCPSGTQVSDGKCVGKRQYLHSYSSTF